MPVIDSWTTGARCGQAYQLLAPFLMIAPSAATRSLENLIEHRPIHQILMHSVTVARTVLANPLPDAHMHPLFYVGVYIAIGILASLVGVASLWIVLTKFKAGTVFHSPANTGSDNNKPADSTAVRFVRH